MCLKNSALIRFVFSADLCFQTVRFLISIIARSGAIAYRLFAAPFFHCLLLSIVHQSLLPSFENFQMVSEGWMLWSLILLSYQFIDD